jgi:flagellar hook-basal body complex protein FliE
VTVAAVGGAAFVPPVAPTASAGSTAASSSSGSSFTDGLNQLQGLQDNVDDLSNQLATGQLSDLHTYTIAAAKDQLAVSLTAAMRDKAVDAYNSIMGMQV